MAVRQVEARSLSDINYIAANPPQYPHHPNLRESLTLYISRVPGTRDIILSTLRPQRKNVTATDVANSLYYVHLDLPSDEVLATPRRPENVASPRSSVESARSVIPRKPLPASAKVPKLESGVSDASARQPLTTLANLNRQRSGSAALTSPPAASAAGPPQTGPNANNGGSELGSEQTPALPPRPSAKSPTSPVDPASRKPLGPRPLVATGGEYSATSNFECTTSPQQYGTTIPEPVLSTQPFYGVRPSSPVKAGHRPSVMPFSLTLIRRDPTTGGQWNIGKILSFQTNIPTPDMADPGLNPEDMGAVSRPQKIDIRIETSGYAKYRGMPSIATVDAFKPGSGEAFAQAMKGLASGPASTGPAPKALPTEEGFHRQVLMSYSKSLASNIKDIKDRSPFRRRHRAESSAAAEGTGSFSHEDFPPPRKLFHRREGSASTVGSTDSAPREEGRDKKAADALNPLDGSKGSPPPSITTEPGPGLKARGYAFTSPWDGRCEFRTSSSGRSLKCRHILDPKSQKFNPAAVAQAIKDAQAMGRSRGDELTSALAGAKPVSELRFNLAVFRPKTEGQGEGGKGKWDPHHLHGQFNKFLHLEPRSSDDDDWDDDDEPMDMSLGKEDAGGGSSGKRAKLGKLIIHDEGLKMLDLVVAANVGVWWTSWERTFA